jgi:EmrB/QacA subfamily drug resistance transporter
MKQVKESPAPLPRRVFLVTVSGTFLVALDLSIVNVAFPSISRSFPEASTATLSWVLSAYSVVFGALLLGAGRIADRSGRRRAFLAGLAVFGAGSALCGLAPTAGLLIAGRVVQAVGAALIMPAALALLLVASPAEARPRAVAAWGGISALAVALGPSVGSVLISAGGWRWAFVVNLPVVLAAIIATRRLIPESIVGGPAPDLLGIAGVSATVAALALGITSGERYGWTSALVLSAFAASAVFGALTVVRSRHHAAPAIDPALFRSRTAVLANAATLAYAIAFFSMLLGNVLFLTTVWGYTTLQAGLAVTPGPLLVAVLAGPTGRLAGRRGYRPVLVTGAMVFAGAHVLLATVIPPTSDYLGRWLPVSLVAALGVALTFPVLSAAAVAGLPSDRFGVGGALNQTARQLGAVLGVALLVAVLGARAGIDPMVPFRSAWFMGAGFAVLSALISAFQRPVRRPAERPAIQMADRPAVAPQLVPEVVA